MASPSAIVRGYETVLAANLSAELQARMQSAVEVASIRILAVLEESIARYTDTGVTADGISVEPLGAFGRSFGIIATSKEKSSEWLDKGTAYSIRRPSGKAMPVGARSPDRRNAPAKYAGTITMAKVVKGQDATHWFSAPRGVPLNETMGNIVRGLFRRTR